MPIYGYNKYLKLMRPLPELVNRDIYDIPIIEKQDIDIKNLNNGQWLINMKNTKPTDPNAGKKIVHAFCYDDVLKREFNNPLGFLHKVAKYYAVASFDFSMHKQMDFKQILCATYDNRWMGAFLQANGMNVIATVGWVDKKTFDICFAGLRNGSTFMISTLGVNNIKCSPDFLTGYYEMRKRFPNSQIICLGNKVSGMDSDICYIPYRDSFGNWEKYPGCWQPSLVNWDGSMAYGGDA